MNSNQKKRISIRQKINRIILSITVTSLLVAGIQGMVGILTIRSKSTSMLLKQTEEQLLSTVVNKAMQAELELGQIASYGRMFSTYAHNIYMHKNLYTPHPVLPPDPVNAGKYAMQRCIASEDYHLSDFKEEMDLLGNLEQIYEPVIKVTDNMKMNIYVGAESGFLIGYDKDSGYDENEEPDEEYYNYFEASWYKSAKEKRGTFFTDVYQDSIGRGLMVSCASPFYDEKSAFAGAFCLDIHIEDLYQTLIDVTMLKDSSVFLIDRQGNTISADESTNVYTNNTLDTTVRAKLKGMETGIILTDDEIYYAFAPILATDWELCIFVPKKSVMVPIQSMNQHIFFTIFSLILVLLAMIVFVLFLSKKFAHSLIYPLEALTRDVEEISQGNLDQEAQIFYNDEIGDVANGVNIMAASLKEYIANLSSVTEEKERIENKLHVANQVQQFYSKVLDNLSDEERSETKNTEAEDNPK